MVGELAVHCLAVRFLLCFSLVAEIGWLASPAGDIVYWDSPMFQSRCRDWVVGEFVCCLITE